VDVRSITPAISAHSHPAPPRRDLDAFDVSGRAPTSSSQILRDRFLPGKNPWGKHVTLTFYPGVSREVVELSRLKLTPSDKLALSPCVLAHRQFSHRIRRLALFRDALAVRRPPAITMNSVSAVMPPFQSK